MTRNEEAGFGVEPESRPTRSTGTARSESTAPPDRSAILALPAPHAREAARLSALPEEEWREELAAALWDCERLRRFDIDDILVPSPRQTMGAEERRRLRRDAALHILKTTSEAA